MPVLCSKVLDSTVCAITNLLSEKLNIYSAGQTQELVGFTTKIRNLTEQDFEVIGNIHDKTEENK